MMMVGRPGRGRQLPAPPERRHYYTRTDGDDDDDIDDDEFETMRSFKRSRPPLNAQEEESTRALLVHELDGRP